MIDLSPIILTNGMVKYPCLSISPTRITAYMTYEGHAHPLKGKKPEAPNKEQGFISKKGATALERAVYWFLYSVDPAIVNYGKNKNKVTFLTLTLPSEQVHSDKEIKKVLLNQMLTELRNVYDVEKFIWKAEKQFNGNLHFHLLLDRFIPALEIRERWNRICNKLGYTYEYHKKMSALDWSGYWELRKKEFKPKFESEKVFRSRIKKAFRYGQLTNWMQPNTTDIENLKKVNNVGAYIAKYMSKEHKAKNVDKSMLAVDGRIWFSSQAVSKMKNLIIEIPDENEYSDEFIEMISMYSTKNKVFESDNVISLGVPIDQLRYKGFKKIPTEFDQHCKDIFTREKNIESFENEQLNKITEVETQPEKEEIIKPGFQQLNLNI
nr:hypothetical protein [uncultured Carboxylicivirga sp.]